MSAKVKGQPVAVPEPDPPLEDWRTPPTTTEDCLARIRALGRSVDGHIAFMCGADKLPSTSAEATQRAVVAFYERLRVMERVLGTIREELFLG